MSHWRSLRTKSSFILSHIHFPIHDFNSLISQEIDLCDTFLSKLERRDDTLLVDHSPSRKGRIIFSFFGSHTREYPPDHPSAGRDISQHIELLCQRPIGDHTTIGDLLDQNCQLLFHDSMKNKVLSKQ